MAGVLDQQSSSSAHPIHLGELLRDLHQYGDVWLTSSHRSVTGNQRFIGWRCKVDLESTHAGVSGEARSEPGHATPELAAAECLDRCRAAFGAAGS